MANARLLPSGAYQTRATKVINGRKITKSFTVHPKECQGDTKKAKKLSEFKAKEWQLSSDHSEIYGLTVKEAIEVYIQDKERVLSPSTIRGYRLILDAFNSVWNIYINDIETPQIQRLVNEWSYDLKTKTIKNRITMLLSVLDYHGIDKRFKIRYPQGNSTKIVTPDIQDVQMFISNAKEDFRPIIYLAAFASLRRGEIAGLREMDISRDMHTITINGVIVLNSDKEWIYKPFPKTQDSVRTIQLPEFIIDSLPIRDNPKDFIFTLTPAAMTDRFRRLAEKLQLNYTLHSLRHFAASFRTDLGIPKKYIQEVGGWIDNSKVLDRIYDNTMASSRKKYTQIANNFIEETFFRDKKTSTI